MVANDNEELPHLTYFLQAYWNEAVSYGELELVVGEFTREQERFLRGLLNDLEIVEDRGLFADRWPKPGPLADFWTGLGADRILSTQDAGTIRRVIEAHFP